MKYLDIKSSVDRNFLYNRSMKITMLGTGTGLIRSKRSSPAVLIETATGESAIVDCGWGVPGAINKLGISLHSLNHLAISHRHADHISALPALLQSQLIANIQHLPGDARQDQLIIHGYLGVSNDITMISNMMIPELNVEKDLRIIEHGNNALHRLRGLTISGVSVRHVETMPAVSFCFEADGKKAIVTGDLGWDERILTQLQNADIAIMDASATQHEYEKQPIRSHLAPIQCGELAARANVKHLVLTSLYERESIQEVTSAVRKHYSGTLTIPDDFQVLELEEEH
jgi:ribonuclease BN (tRNA processing enzyme)